MKKTTSIEKAMLISIALIATHKITLLIERKRAEKAQLKRLNDIRNSINRVSKRTRAGQVNYPRDSEPSQ